MYDNSFKPQQKEKLNMNNLKFPGTLVLTLIVLNLLTIAGHTQGRSDLDLNVSPGTIVLKGTIVTPTGITPGGWIVIENHKITGVYSSMKQFEMPANAICVDTRGIIFPGLIDLHNHVAFNVFPAWKPMRQQLPNGHRKEEKFSNRYEWRYHSAEYKRLVQKPFDNSMKENFFCKMNTYGELRALVGGTTTIGNTSDGGEECLKGLVRNLDDPEQVGQRRIKYSLDIQNHGPQKPGNNQLKCDELCVELKVVKQDLISGNLDAFFIHLAEGKVNDPVSKAEFAKLQSKGLLTDKTAIIHGIALGANEFQAMHDAGTSLIWSPHSNIELYGQTTDILTAKNAGVRIALSPDWAVTGSKSLLDELYFAAGWNKEHLNNLLSDKDLVEMVTSIPASIAGVDDKVGSIQVGLYADLLVISGDSTQPYSSLVQADTDDVKLVLVNGSPVYGTQDLMEKFWNISKLEFLLNSTLARPAMMLKLPLPKESGGTFKELQHSLKIKLAEEGTTLAPLFLVIKRPKTTVLDKLPEIKNKKY